MKITKNNVLQAFIGKYQVSQSIGKVNRIRYVLDAHNIGKLKMSQVSIKLKLKVTGQVAVHKSVLKFLVSALMQNLHASTD